MIQFIKIQIKLNMGYILLLLIAPPLFTALLSFMVKSSQGELQHMPYTPHNFGSFPSELAKYPIAFTPVDADTTRIMDGVAQQLGFTDVRQFVDLPTMQSHFVEANLRGVADDSIQKFEELIQANEAALPFILDKTAFHAFLTTDYKQNYLNLPPSPPPKADPLLFGIYFDSSASKTNYSVYFNQNLFSQFTTSFNRFRSNFVKGTETTFDHLGFFIQAAVEKQLLNVNVQHRLGAISRTDSKKLLPFTTYQLAYVLPISAPGVIFQIIASEFSTQFLKLPKRLGASASVFQVFMFSFGTALVFLSCFFQMLTATIFKIEPFSSFDVGTLLYFSLLQGIVQSSFCGFVALIKKKTTQIIVNLLFNFSFTIFPMIISQTYSGYKSLYDSQIVDFGVTGTLLFLIQPMMYFGILDWFASAYFLQTFDNNTLKKLFTTDLTHTRIYGSANTFSLIKLQDLTGMIIGSTFAYQLLINYLQKILNGENSLGYPWLYFLDKKYYQLRKKLNLCKKNSNTKLSNDFENQVKTLTFSGVSKKYGSCKKQKEVLRDISFSARTGQIVGLMGLSGCGKTTICRITQHEIQAGRGSQIKFEDMDLLDQYSSLYTHVVASCPQDKSNIMQNASIKDNIRVCKEYIRWTEKSIDMDGYIESLTKILKLAEHQDKKYDELSGGMQRRLSLLIALIQTPQVLVLDEITANVDPQLKHDIWNVLNDYQQKFNRIIVITSHDSFELQYICSNVVHIHDGVVQTNSSVFQMLRDKGMKEHTASINELFFNKVSTDEIQKIGTEQSEIFKPFQLDRNENNEKQNIELPKINKAQHKSAHKINYLKFSSKLRYYWHFNNKFVMFVVMIIMNIVFSIILKIIAGGQSKTPTVDIKGALQHLISTNSITTQNQFQNLLKDTSKQIIQISKKSPVQQDVQNFKNLVFFDSLSQYQMSLGDYSMFVGEMMMPHQYVNYLVQDGADVDPVAQYKAVFQQTACASLDYHVSSAVHSGCSAPVLQDFVPRVADFGGQAFNTPIYVNFSSMKKAKEYISKHAPEKEYNFKYLDQTLDFQISRFVPYPLSIIDHHGDVIDVYVRTPAVSTATDTYTDLSFPKMFYSNLNWYSLYGASVHTNSSFIVNYQNDFLTRYHASLLRKQDPNYILSANFIQQPEFKNNFSTKNHYLAFKGELQFGSFYPLILPLLVLTLINSNFNDSHKILRNQLEGLGFKQLKYLLFQIIINFVQILLSITIFILVFLAFSVQPQLSVFDIYLTFILGALQYSIQLLNYFQRTLVTSSLPLCCVRPLSVHDLFHHHFNERFDDFNASSARLLLLLHCHSEREHVQFPVVLVNLWSCNQPY
ncbi:ABC_transporter family protein [Hexamita inflata]|uniref:ABC_transporter family protein n=1 Tax=Hexamita inflata TaxID=28002 RepID=A0ABP1IZE1_9EUKA